MGGSVQYKCDDRTQRNFAFLFILKIVYRYLVSLLHREFMTLRAGRFLTCSHCFPVLWVWPLKKEEEGGRRRKRVPEKKQLWVLAEEVSGFFASHYQFCPHAG